MCKRPAFCLAPPAARSSTRATPEKWAMQYSPPGPGSGGSRPTEFGQLSTPDPGGWTPRGRGTPVVPVDSDVWIARLHFAARKQVNRGNPKP